MLGNAGVRSSPAVQPNGAGLVTFDGNESLIFSSIKFDNVQIPDEWNVTSLVYFNTTGNSNITITNWTSGKSTCPRKSPNGLINVQGDDNDHIVVQGSNVQCSPFCFTMGVASPDVTQDNGTRSLAITNSAFENDKVVRPSGGDYFELTAAVWANLTGVLVVKDCSFTGFLTDYGSLSVHATNVTVANSNFSGNGAATAGGGLFITGTGGWGPLGPQGFVKGWDSNSASEGGWVWIQDSNFTNNHVFGSGGGGAVNIVNMGNIIINGCRYDQNRASGPADGSAIHILGTTQQNANIYVNNTVITANSAAGNSTPGNTTCNVLLESVRCVAIEGTVVENNSGIGVCIHYAGGGCTVQDPIWNFDRAPMGATLFNFTTLNMDNVSTEIAEFSEYGSAYGSFTQLYSRSNSQSGDISGYYQASQGMCIDVRASIFRNNTAVDRGDSSNPFNGGAGLEIKTAQPVVIANCVFEKNVGNQGSGVHLDACPSTLIWNSSFDQNSAEYEGGAVALVNSNGQGVMLAACNLTRNTGMSS